MTIEARIIKLKYFITCLKCEVSGKVCDDNCPIQYEAGKLGEIIENLEAISKALDHYSCDAYDLEDILNECTEIEAITKDQYEARLKDDTNLILDKIKTTICEHMKAIKNLDIARVSALRWCLDVIDKYYTSDD